VILALVTLSCLSSTTAVEIRVASYNIRHGVGLDRKLDLDRTAGVIRRIDPHLVGLQEVDNRARRSQGIPQAEFLGRALRMQSRFGKSMDFEGGGYGMAALSKFPIRRTESIRLPEGNEPRVALLTEVELPGGRRIALVNVHFDWVGNDDYRYAQARHLRDRLRNLGMPFVLLGDFNDRRGSRTLALFQRIADESRKQPGQGPTFPADDSSVEIDHIFFGPPGAWEFSPTEVIDERAASDHRPLVARGRLRD